jgi:hypothetical protein
VYPLLVLVGTWSILVANLVGREGWLGGLGQILGSDFVTLYAAGQAYFGAVDQLYDLERQAAYQQALIAPTALAGVNPFISPPQVALAYGALTALPPVAALLVWSGLTFGFVVLAAWIGARYLAPDWLVRAGLSPLRLSIVVLSSFAFVEGVIVGQNHGLTLLLVSGVCAATLRQRWTLAGALAGLLLYKPHVALGFLVLWLVWRRWRALAAFGGVALSWVGLSVVLTGLEPYLAYARFLDQVLLLPYREGFPTYIMVTPYGLLTSWLPASFVPLIRLATNAIALSGVLLLGWSAYRTRHLPPAAAARPLALAVLFPLVALPYALLHDLLILVPFFLLWVRQPGASNLVLRAAIVSYLCTLLVPLISQRLGLALLALLPLGLVGLLVRPGAHLQSGWDSERGTGW